MPHSVECYPGARGIMVGQPGAGGIWMGQFLGAMGAERLGLRAEMSRLSLFSLGRGSTFLSMLGSLHRQEHSCSQGRVYYLQQQTSHRGSLGCFIGLWGLKLVKEWFLARIGQNLQNRVLLEQPATLVENTGVLTEHFY